MQTNPVVWFEIYVQDMPRAKAFYETLLGIELSRLGDPNDEAIEMWSFPSEMNQFGAGGALVKMADAPSGPGGSLVYLGCEDCGPVAQRAGANGGSVSREKFSIGEFGHIALINDTEGNMIGLHSMQ